MSRQSDIKKLINEHYRHLQKLEEQKASFGVHTPPHILTGIENEKEEIHRLQNELAYLNSYSFQGKQPVLEMRNSPLSGFGKVIIIAVVTIVLCIISSYIFLVFRQNWPPSLA